MAGVRSQASTPARLHGVHGCPPGTTGDSTLCMPQYGFHYKSVPKTICALASHAILALHLHIDMQCTTMALATPLHTLVSLVLVWGTSNPRERGLAAPHFHHWSLHPLLSNPVASSIPGPPLCG